MIDRKTNKNQIPCVFVMWSILSQFYTGTLGDSLDAGEDAFSYSDIPHFPISTAPSHKSRLLFGKLSGVSVVLMQGRFHLYEGYSIQKVSIFIWRIVVVLHLVYHDQGSTISILILFNIQVTVK